MRGWIIDHAHVNGVARIFVWGGATRYIFVTSPRESTAFSGGGGVVAEISVISITGSDSVGGGVVAEIFPVNKSITFPRFRDILGTFSAHMRLHIQTGGLLTMRTSTEG